MLVETLKSGSDGNGYVLKTRDEYLLLECGVKAKEILKSVNYDVTKIVGCLVTHGHIDHAKYVKEYTRYGFPIFSAHELKADVHVQHIGRMKKNRIGGFTVVPFRVPHNETDCDGYLISHKEFGNLVFITDAEMCPYDLSGVGINHAIVECNYSLDYLEVTEINKGHVLCGHMELQTCKRFLRSIYSEKLQTIGLIHLSKTNGDPERFRREIQEEFPSTFVWIAEKGMVIDTNKWNGVGRLTKDVDCKVNGDLTIARFTVACDRRFKRDGDPTADFINCVAFGKTAEFVNKYFAKGSRIGLAGRITTGSYTNKDGEKIYTTEVTVEEVEFVESKNGSGQQKQAQAMPPQMGVPNMPQNQPYAPQGTNMPPQYQTPVTGQNTTSQGYSQQPQYQQQYQQPPQQQSWMNIAPDSGDENPFI